MLANALLYSGLIANPSLQWVTFHGQYDYAYLLKLLTGNSLPQSSQEFLGKVTQFFPRHLDTKVAGEEFESLRKLSLQKTAEFFGVWTLITLDLATRQSAPSWERLQAHSAALPPSEESVRRW